MQSLNAKINKKTLANKLKNPYRKVVQTNGGGNERMLTVPKQQYIKLMREIEGCTISDIANRAQINWRTAKKYADCDDWNIKVGLKQRKHPVMGAYKDIVDTWLMEDACLPKKQRHTATRIYQRLVAEHQFAGSIRTVSDFVKKRREALVLEEAQAYQKLEHPGGEAQVDFCTVHVSKDGQLLEYKLLIASLPYSNAAFVYPLPKENQECFLEGLKQVFEQMGGVPKRIWFDNLSAAVIAIEKEGKRKCTDAFVRFSAHYRFDAVFCNPYSTNEKGNVENKCGYSRRNWCVPVPIFTSHEAFVADLLEQAAADRKRPHYEKKLIIDALWQEEKSKLLTLPDHSYDVFRLATGKVNLYGEIRLDKTNLPITGVKPGEEVLEKIYWDHVEVLNTQYKLLANIPRSYTHKTIEMPWTEIIKGLKRKPRSVTHSRFVMMMPAIIQQFIQVNDLEKRQQRLSLLSEWLKVYLLTEIGTTLEKEPNWEQETFRDRMIHQLYALKHSKQDETTILTLSTIVSTHDYQPDLTAYDRLHNGGKTA